MAEQEVGRVRAGYAERMREQRRLRSVALSITRSERIQGEKALSGQMEESMHPSAALFDAIRAECIAWLASRTDGKWLARFVEDSDWGEYTSFWSEAFFDPAGGIKYDELLWNYLVCAGEYEEEDD